MTKFIFLFLSVLSLQAMATTFLPLSIKKQIVESEEIIKGRVELVQSEHMSDGIVSFARIKVDHWLGSLAPETEYIDVYFPGGEIGDEVYKIHGAPSFEIGENVVLFGKRDKCEVWINNLGLGKFSLKSLGTKEVLVNQVFPNNPKVGQITWNKFVNLAEWMKKEKFQERLKDKYELNKDKEARARVTQRDKGRSIASVNQSKVEKNIFSANWLVFLLALLIVVFTIIRKKTS